MNLKSRKKLPMLLVLAISALSVSILSIASEQIQSQAENVQIIFDPINGHNHNGTNSAKLAANSVNTTQIVDNSVTNSKISGPISIAKGGTGLTSLGSANQVLRVNGAGTALEYATSSSGNGQNGDVVHNLSTTLGDYSSPTAATPSSALSKGTTETFDNSAGWTLTGNSAITGGKYQSGAYNNNVTPTAIAHLTQNLSSNNFTIDFDFIFSAVGSTNNAVGIFGVSNHDDVRSSGATGDFIGAQWNTASNKIVIHYKIDTSSHTSGSESGGTLSESTQYYGRLARSGNTVTFSVYSDSNRTTLVTSCTATITSSLNNLDRVVMAYGQATVANSDGNVIIDNVSGFEISDRATTVYDNNSGTKWQSLSENKPFVNLDLGANKDLASVAINLDRTITNATTIKVYSSTDANFTSNEVIVNVNVSDFTDDVWRFILNNRLPENKRYILIEAQENSVVLAINEVKYREITDWSRHFHDKRDVTNANSFLDSN